MSDLSQGPGWWQATDGKWYPPEQHPNYRATTTESVMSTAHESPVYSSVAAQTTPPPGWYLDPNDPTRHRYWDGTSWTLDTRPAGSPTQSPASQQQQALELTLTPWREAAADDHSPQTLTLWGTETAPAGSRQPATRSAPAVVASAIRKTALTTWEGIWYVIMCIGFGAGYFGKIPAKKALKDYGLTEMTGAEHFWYVLMCIGFGAGYFAKIPVAKALSELPQNRSSRRENLGTLY